MEVIEIKNRWNEAVLYSGEHADVKEAGESAVKAGANLADANLKGATLARAYLTGAYLALLLRILKYQLSCKAQIKPSLRITLSADGRSLSQREKQGLCLFPWKQLSGNGAAFYGLVVLYQ